MVALDDVESGVRLVDDMGGELLRRIAADGRCQKYLREGGVAPAEGFTHTGIDESGVG